MTDRSRFAQFEARGVSWEADAEFAGRLEKVLLSPGEPIKASTAKSVTRHRVDGRIFYIKRYQHDAVPFRRFKFLFKSSQARQEWELAQALAERGVPIVRHLALGERRSWTGVHESTLITQGFDGIPLESAPKTNPEAVLRFVERMHAAGVLQEDLHPGNLLVRPEPLEIRLVDLHGTVLKPALTSEDRERNLAKLSGGFITLPVDARIRARSAAIRRRFLYERSRRCLRRNREFDELQAGNLNWRTRVPAMTASVRQVLEDPDGFLATRARLLKNGRSATVGVADGLVLKRYNLRKYGNLIKDWFRLSKARRSYQKAYHLEMAGVPTPRVLATADRRFAGFLVRSYLLMDEVAGAVSLGAHLQQCHHVDSELIRQTAHLIAKVHRLGLSHRDLKESNLLLDNQGRLHLIDLDGLEYVDVVSITRTAADLERFAFGVEKHSNVTRAHRAAFLRHYCRARGILRLR